MYSQNKTFFYYDHLFFFMKKLLNSVLCKENYSLFTITLFPLSMIFLKRYFSFQKTATQNKEKYFDVKEVSEECECQYGFKREEFKKNIEDLKNSVGNQNVHIFVTSGKKSTEWEENEDKTVLLLIINKEFINNLTKEIKKNKNVSPRITLIEDKSIGEGKKFKNKKRI
jgi:hypothetical protein